MGSRRAGARTKKPVRLLRVAGIALAAVGCALLVAPVAVPIAGFPGTGGRIAATIALLVGASLAGVDLLLQARSRAQQATVPRQEPNWTSWAPPETLAAMQRAIPQGGSISSFADTDGDTGTAPLAAEPPRREPAWSRKVFDDIEWRRFEAVCEKLFEQAGFEARTQSLGAGGGVDIWLHSRHADGPAAVVRCRHGDARPVDAKEVRDLLGVMRTHRLKRGTYATTSAFAGEAAQFARENGVNALDGAKLLALIAKRTPQQQLELLQIAYEGEFWRPTCTSCGTKMVEREATGNASRFWGCTRFPRCKAILPMRAAA